MGPLPLLGVHTASETASTEQTLTVIFSLLPFIVEVKILFKFLFSEHKY